MPIMDTQLIAAYDLWWKLYLQYVSDDSDTPCICCVTDEVVIYNLRGNKLRCSKQYFDGLFRVIPEIVLNVPLVSALKLRH